MFGWCCGAVDMDDSCQSVSSVGQLVGRTVGRSVISLAEHRTYDNIPASFLARAHRGAAALRLLCWHYGAKMPRWHRTGVE
jgi:hypothetical protein